MRSSTHTALPHASAGGGVWYVAFFRLMASSDFNIQPLTFSSIPSFHHVKACGRITFFSSLGMLCAAFVSIFFKHVAASSNHTGQIKTSHSPSSIMLISLYMLRFASTYIRTLCLLSIGMASHPPIPVMELADHIERLKANDNLKFSQEYEVIISCFVTFCREKSYFCSQPPLLQGPPIVKGNISGIFCCNGKVFFKETTL